MSKLRSAHACGRWLALSLLATSVSVVFGSSAAGLPPLTIPEGVGVNIHFVTGHTADLDKIAAAGFKFIRMDFGWASIERKKDTYDWAGYDELMKNLDARGLRAVFILDYSNPLYEEKVTSKNPINGEMHTTVSSPQHPESVAAYAKWAAAAVNHFKGRHVIWEIWNEPNIHFWAPKPDVAQYTTMALAASKAMRASDPQATIVGPATSTVPIDFLEACFKAGLLTYWDAVSVHPYRDYKLSPETASKDYDKLKALISKYAPQGKESLPILSGEWGYATHTKGISLEKQAAFAARQQMANILNGVPVSIWYDWKNDGPDAAEREHNFGTVDANLEPKPAYIAIKTLTQELKGCRLVKRLPAGTDQDYVLLWEDASGTRRLSAWSSSEKGSVEVKLTGTARVTGRAWNGEELSPSFQDGLLKLTLTALPQYISLGAGKPE